MADFVDSQSAVIFAVIIVIAVWLMSFQKGNKKKDPWDFHF
ncbi:MAG: hypothetical protein V1835_04075 [Candidatus Micrarchaeota archaeon]